MYFFDAGFIESYLGRNGDEKEENDHHFKSMIGTGPFQSI